MPPKHLSIHHKHKSTPLFLLFFLQTSYALPNNNIPNTLPNNINSNITNNIINNNNIPNNNITNNNTITIDNSINIPHTPNNAYLDYTQNNTPLVNINKANSDGISPNYYKDFNINQNNLILNNYKGDSTNTQLGGVVYGNPNFNNDYVNNTNNNNPATIILNEVTTNRITNINGYLEVAGNKADVIIANPNGLMINGGGFLNINRLSLITASSINKETNSSFDNNNTLNPFIITDTNINPNAIIQVVGRNITDKEGNPIVYNLGIDINNINYADLISRIVKINGLIKGSDNTELTIKTGNDKATYDNNNKLNVSSTDTTTDTTTTPEFAIDSTVFGGIYSGKITFIATERGVGVRIRSDLMTTTDDLNFDINGNLIIEDTIIQSKNKDINIKAKEVINYGTDNIDNNTNTYTKHKITIPNTPDPLYEYVLTDYEEAELKVTSNSSYIKANNNINIIADTLTNYNSTIIANNDININTNILNNKNLEINVPVNYYYRYHGKEMEDCKYKHVHTYHTFTYTQTLEGTSPSLILANNNLNIVANVIDNGTTNDNLNIKEDTIDNINNITNPNPNKNLLNHLIETNPNFTNTDIFLGSEYFMTRLGLNPDDIDLKYLYNNYNKIKLLNQLLSDTNIKNINATNTTNTNNNIEYIKHELLIKSYQDNIITKKEYKELLAFINNITNQTNQTNQTNTNNNTNSNTTNTIKANNITITKKTNNTDSTNNTNSTNTTTYPSILTNNGNIYASNNLNITMDNLINSSNIISNNYMLLDITNTLNNISSTIATDNGDLVIKSDTFNNIIF